VRVDWWRVAVILLAAAVLTSACSSAQVDATNQQVARSKALGIHTIKHVVVIMQENRSFDNYFGTFPGADGIPMVNGKPSVCVPSPVAHTCIVPFVDHADVNGGGPHGAIAARKDINNGKMNGFIHWAPVGKRGCADEFNPVCTRVPNVGELPDVMGYHTESDIPNYWTYARDFVLQDHMFEPNASWSLPEHLFQVSEWSARCSQHNKPSSCVNALQYPAPKAWRGDGLSPGVKPPIYAWTDLTYLLHKDKVSWGYYVAPGTEPDCENDAATTCAAVPQNSRTPGIWNPLPYFDTVRNDHQLGNIQSTTRFLAAAAHGTLPSVSWVVPSGTASEHPPNRISRGVAWTTGLINAVMRSPDWNSTAIFLAWDDWGGFYDNVRPPEVDENGYGLRVPGMVISPYAKRGYVDHQTLSFDAYAKFIEDDFLGGQRLDPSTDGRPDPRPTVREDVPILGDLARDFDFNQVPRPPVILPRHPQTTLTDPVRPRRLPFRRPVAGLPTTRPPLVRSPLSRRPASRAARPTGSS
jgi:phospholipase C